MRAIKKGRCRPGMFCEGTSHRAARDVVAEALKREGYNPGAAFAIATSQVKKMRPSVRERLARRRDRGR